MVAWTGCTCGVDLTLSRWPKSQEDWGRALDPIEARNLKPQVCPQPYTESITQGMGLVSQSTDIRKSLRQCYSIAPLAPPACPHVIGLSGGDPQLPLRCLYMVKYTVFLPGSTSAN